MNYSTWIDHLSVHSALKNFHKHVLRFAIYGRSKAFVHRDEISAFFESFNVEMDNILKSFAVNMTINSTRPNVADVAHRSTSTQMLKTGKLNTTRQS
jgi:hypothetical protein